MFIAFVQLQNRLSFAEGCYCFGVLTDLANGVNLSSVKFKNVGLHFFLFKVKNRGIFQPLLKVY